MEGGVDGKRKLRVWRIFGGFEVYRKERGGIRGIDSLVVAGDGYFATVTYLI